MNGQMLSFVCNLWFLILLSGLLNYCSQRINFADAKFFLRYLRENCGHSCTFFASRCTSVPTQVRVRNYAPYWNDWHFSLTYDYRTVFERVSQNLGCPGRNDRASGRVWVRVAVPRPGLPRTGVQVSLAASCPGNLRNCTVNIYQAWADTTEA